MVQLIARQNKIKIIKIHRKLLPASKCSEIEDFWHVRNVPFQTDAGLTEFSFDSGFLGHKENIVFRCAKNAKHF